MNRLIEKIAVCVLALAGTSVHAMPLGVRAMMHGRAATRQATPVALSNDNFADAAVVYGASGCERGSNEGATVEDGEPLVEEWDSTASVWWRWTAPSDGDVTFNTFGSSFDTVLGVYVGNNVGDLSIIAENDDADDSTSAVDFSAVAGRTYYIAIGGYGDASGNIVLNWGASGSGVGKIPYGTPIFNIEDGELVGVEQNGATVVVIPDGVTSIGDNAFCDCSWLTSVTIPASVTRIGYNAFRDCDKLTAVHISDLAAWCRISFGGDGANPISCAHNLYLNGSLVKQLSIPNGVTSIGWTAFEGCSGLTSVTIPNSVTSIGESAFSCCSGLTSMTIPASVTNISEGAFYDCSGLKKFNVASGNPSYSSASGLLLTKDGRTLVIGVNGNVVIPDGVTSIEPGAFYRCSGLASVTIGNGVTDIGEGAFSECSALKKFNVVSGNPAYKSVSGLLLTKDGKTLVAAPAGAESVTVPAGVTNIGDNAFSDCHHLKSVTIPKSVTRIGHSAFRIGRYMGYMGRNYTGYYGKCGNRFLEELKEVHIADVAAWCRILFVDNPLTGARNLYLNGSLVTNLVIPNGVTSIGDDAFHACGNLTSVTIPDGVISIGNRAFGSCGGIASVTIPDSVTSIGSGAFCGYELMTGTTVVDDSLCSSLTSVTIGHSVTNIGAGAFGGCYRLKSVTIPDSVTSIGDNAFHGCVGLVSVTMGNGVTSIGGGAFSCCHNLASVAIPNGVTSIGQNAFYHCRNLARVTIPDSVASIGAGAFSSCNDAIFDTTTIAGVTLVDGWAVGNAGSLSGSLDLTGVRGIGVDVFSGCNGLTGVKIPKSVLGIGDGAFCGCSGLADEQGFVIVKNVLYGYFGNATSVRIPDGVTGIGHSAFSGCSKLASVAMPNSVTWIGHSAFSGCCGLTNIAIPKGVTSIEAHSFEGCSGLKNVTIPYGVASIGDWAFSNCSGLTSVTIPSSVTSIGYVVFANSWRLKSVTLPTRFKGNLPGFIFYYDVWYPDWLEIVYQDVHVGGSEPPAPATYAVTYRPGTYGTGALQTATKTEGVALALKGAIFTREGYTQTGWATSDGGAKAYGLGASYTTNAALTLYPFWTKNASPEPAPPSVNAVTVTFNANGGSGDATRQVEKGAAIGELPTAKRKGYTFAGWWTATEQATAKTKVTKNVTYYAKWTANKYKIKFNKNGGKGTMKTLSATYGKKVTLTANAFKRTNCTFAGWSKTKSGAVAYKNKAKVKNLTTVSGKTVSLYAVWKKPSYTVKFNANGGTGAAMRQAIECSSKTALAKNTYVREGFVFAGWATKKNGPVVYKNKAKVKDLAKKGKTVTLYAVWRPAKWAVGTFTGEGNVGGQATLVALTVASSGKISGKFVLAKNFKAYSFKAGGFDGFSDGALRASASLTFGKKKCTLEIAVGRSDETGEAVPVIDVTYKGKEYGWGFVPPS